MAKRNYFGARKRKPVPAPARKTRWQRHYAKNPTRPAEIVGDMTIVYSDKRHIPFLIDASDWEMVKNFRWHVQIIGYPATSPKGVPIPLHQFLLGRAPDGLVWDHENRNPLDNRRKNIRAVTQAINSANQRPRVKPRQSSEQRLDSLVAELKVLILKDLKA